MQSWLLDNINIVAYTFAGIFIATGIMAMLQHHYLAGVVVLLLALLPTIFQLLSIKRIHGSIYNKETFVFVFSTVLMAVLFMVILPLVNKLFP